MGLPIWARWVRVQGRGQGDGRRARRAGRRRRRDDQARRHRRRSTPTASPWSRQARVDEVLAASLAREEKERVKRDKLRGGALSYDLDGLRAVVEAQRDALTRRTSPTSARSRCSRRSLEESLEFFTEIMGMEIEAPGRAIGLPARLGRLPALVAEADRVGHVGHGRARPAGVEPRGAGAPRRAGRRRRAGGGLDRRRPRPRAVLPLPRPRRPRASSSTTRSSATSRPSTCARR